MRRIFNRFLNWLCGRLDLCGLDMNEGDLMSPEW